MATRHSADTTPSDPADLLPEDSVLTFEEYLDMQRTIGHPIRFRILYTLKHDAELSARDLEDSLGVRANTLHYHLDKLIDVGLVQNRKRKTPDRDGLYSYYRATSLGTGILDDGVEALMRREWTFHDAYNSDA